MTPDIYAPIESFAVEPVAPSKEVQRKSLLVDRQLFQSLEAPSKVLEPKLYQAISDSAKDSADPVETKALIFSADYITRKLPEAQKLIGDNFGGWPTVKAAFAKNHLKLPSGDLTDSQLFLEIGKRLKKEQDEEELWTGSSGKILEAAIKGEPFTATWSGIMKTAENDPRFMPEVRDQRRKQLQDTYSYVASKAQALLPLAEEAQMVLKNVGGTDKPLTRANNQQSINALTLKVAELSKDDRDLFAQLVAAKSGPAPDKGAFDKIMAKTGRTVMSVASVGRNMFMANLAERSAIAAMPDEELIKNYYAFSSNPTADIAEFRGQVTKDQAYAESRLLLDKIANGVIDPADFSNRIANAFAEAPGMIAYSATAALPFAGFPLIFQATYAASQQDMLENGVQWKDVGPMALSSAMIQAPIEMLQGKMLLDGASVFTKMATKPLVEQSAWAFTKRFALLASAEGVAQNATEFFQDATPLVIQEVVSQFNEDVPPTVAKQWEDFRNQRVDTAIAMLPLILGGAGGASFADRSFGQAYLRSQTALQAIGFTEQATQEIQGAINQDNAEEVFQAAYNDPEKRVMGTELQKAAVAKMDEENKQKAEELNTGAQIKLEASGEYSVFSATGELIDRAQTEEAALAIKNEVDVADRMTESERVTDLVQWMRERGGAQTEQVAQQGPRLMETDQFATKQEAQAAVDEYIKTGDLAVGSTPDNVRVVGMAARRYDASKRVYEHVVRLFNGADPMVVFEEQAEAYYKARFDQGSLSQQQVESWQDAVEGKQVRDGLSDAQRSRNAVEFFSRSARAYVLGRGNQEKALPMSFRTILSSLRDSFKALLGLSKRMMELSDAKQLPEGFEPALRQALRLDNTFTDFTVAESVAPSAQSLSGPSTVAAPATPSKPKKGRIKIPLPANGVADILNDIQDYGGVPNSGKNAGGEYDGFKEAFGRGMAKLLVRGKSGKGGGIDTWLEDFGSTYGTNYNGDIERFYSDVIKAVENRRKIKVGVGAQTEQAGQETVQENTAQTPVSSSDLSVGDVFHINGEKFTVMEITPDLDVVIKDGVTTTIPDGQIVDTDKGVESKATKAEFGELLTEDYTMLGESAIDYTGYADAIEKQRADKRAAEKAQSTFETFALRNDEHLGAVEDNIRQRKLAWRIETNKSFDETLRKAAATMLYERRSMQRGDEEAAALVRDNDGDFNRLLALINGENKIHPDTKTALVSLMLNAANERGDYVQAEALLDQWSDWAVTAGQTVNGFKRFSFLDTAVGAQTFLRKQIDKQNDKLKREPTPEQTAIVGELLDLLNEPTGNGQLAWLTMDGKPATSRLEAINDFLKQAKNSVWDKEKASIVAAIEKRLGPAAAPKTPSILQLFSKDIREAILASLPDKAKTQGTKPTDQELANRAADVFANPEKFTEALEQARASINDGSLDDKQKAAALAALDSVEKGENPIAPILTELIKRAFDELGTTPKNAAKQGNVAAQGVADNITAKVAGLFDGRYKEEVTAEVQSVVGNMLADARKLVEEAFTRNEIKRQFLAADEVDIAGRLLANGTDQEIRDYLGKTKLADENSRLAMLRKTLADLKAQMREKVTTPAELEAALLKRLKAKKIALPADIGTTVTKALDLFNEGRLSAKGLQKVFAEKYTIPNATPADLAKMAELASNIASTPKDSSERVFQTVKLYDYVRSKVNPYDVVDAGLGLWYSGVLSSVITQGRNVGGNLSAVVFDGSEVAITQMLQNPSLAMLQLENMLGGVVAAGKVGLSAAVDNVKTGRQMTMPGRDYAIERGSNVLEGDATITGTGGAVAEKLRTVAQKVPIARIMMATDAFFSFQAYEMYSRKIAFDMVAPRVKDGSLTHEQAAQEIARLLGNQDTQVAAATAQAEAEWNALTPEVQASTAQETWVKNRANEFRMFGRTEAIKQPSAELATQAVLQQDYEGILGAIGAAIQGSIARVSKGVETIPHPGLRLVAKAGVSTTRLLTVPFLKTPINFANNALNYGPFGFARAALYANFGAYQATTGTFRTPTPEEKARILGRAVYGTVGMGLLLMLCFPPSPDDDQEKAPWMQVHGRGSGDRAKDQKLNGPKYKPFSLEFRVNGNKFFFDYRLMPVGLYLAMIGKLHDDVRYGKKEEDTNAAQTAFLFGHGMFTAASSQTPLSAMAQLVDAASDDQGLSLKATNRIIARATVGMPANMLIPYAGFFRSIDSLAGTDRRVSDTMSAAILSQLPFGSRFNGQEFDVLGDPIAQRAGIGWLADWQDMETPEGRIYAAFQDRNAIPTSLDHYKKKLGPQFEEFKELRGKKLKRLLLENNGEKLQEFLAQEKTKGEDETYTPAQKYMRELSADSRKTALNYLQQEDEQTKEN